MLNVKIDTLILPNFRRTLYRGVKYIKYCLIRGQLSNHRFIQN